MEFETQMAALNLGAEQIIRRALSQRWPDRIPGWPGVYRPAVDATYTKVPFRPLLDALLPCVEPLVGQVEAIQKVDPPTSIESNGWLFVDNWDGVRGFIQSYRTDERVLAVARAFVDEIMEQLGVQVEEAERDSAAELLRHNAFVFPAEVAHNVVGATVSDYMNKDFFPDDFKPMSHLLSSTEPLGETSVQPATVSSVAEQVESLESQKRGLLDGALGRVAITNDQIEDLRTQLDAEVLEARGAGATWAEVGDAVGITAQAANQRWNPEAKRRHAEYQRRRTSQSAPEPAPD